MNEESVTRTFAVEEEEGTAGAHAFHIVASTRESLYSCAVVDSVLPHPAAAHLLTPHKAAEFALLHCRGMSYQDWHVLKKICTNDCTFPNQLIMPPNPHCQPRLRTIHMKYSCKRCASGCWIYRTLGSAEALSDKSIGELSLLLFAIKQSEKRSSSPGQF